MQHYFSYYIDFGVVHILKHDINTFGICPDLPIPLPHFKKYYTTFRICLNPSSHKENIQK